MGKIQQVLDEKLMAFISAQKMFFVASAPASLDGYVNTSPKGYESFHIFDEKTVGFIDYPGSGNETARHILENERLTIMFCSFEEETLIVRLYGRGEVIEKGNEQFETYAPLFPERFGPWLRQMIILHIDRVKSSCGESVPYYEYKGQREDLHDWAVKMEEKGKLSTYIEQHR